MQKINLVTYEYCASVPLNLTKNILFSVIIQSYIIYNNTQRLVKNLFHAMITCFFYRFCTHVIYMHLLTNDIIVLQ